MTRKPLLINGVPVPDGPRWRPPPPAPPEPKPRVFDHFVGDEPEDVRFSQVARAMRQGVLRPGDYGPTAWWQTMPERDEPIAVAGELSARTA